ncbi:hypothetical protein ASZ78_012584, partial [Callipepla squamata]
AHFQRRNWTPQAMLYLKGAQGRRFISDESQRKDLYGRMQLEGRRFISDESQRKDLYGRMQLVEEENSDHPGYLMDNLSNW